MYYDNFLFKKTKKKQNNKNLHQTLIVFELFSRDHNLLPLHQTKTMLLSMEYESGIQRNMKRLRKGIHYFLTTVCNFQSFLNVNNWLVMWSKKILVFHQIVIQNKRVKLLERVLNQVPEYVFELMEISEKLRNFKEQRKYLHNF